MRRRRIAGSGTAPAPTDAPAPRGDCVPVEGTHVVESGVPLSRSVLWACQRRFFEEAGVDAWRKNVVPHQITSNALIARCYAQLLLAWMRDLRAAGGLPAGGRPIPIIELGSGSGQFSFHFLREFAALLEASPLAGVRYRYLATDFFQGTLDHQKAHPRLAPWAEQGLLDFALFDAEKDDRLKLQKAGATLGPGSIQGPCAVIANYVFDGIAADVFRAGGGLLDEGLLTLTSPQAEPDGTAPALIARANGTYEFRPAAQPYYAEASYNRLLQDYADDPQLRTFPFPFGALRCMDRLRAIAPGRMLLITADKGFHRPQDVGRFGAPYFTAHGSFSISVNYHALGRAWEREGALFLTTAHPSSGIDVCAALFGSGAYAETRAAYRQFIELQGPDDLFGLCTAALPREPKAGVAEVLRYLRFTGWDSSRALKCMRILIDKAAGASRREQAELAVAVDQIWAHYFHLQDGRDLPHSLAVISAQMDRNAEAMEFLRHSLALRGPSGPALKLMAMCAYETGDKAAALEAVRRWRAIEPDSEEAEVLDRGLTEEIAG